MNYATPTEEASAEILIKKSRFIAHAKQIVSREAAMSWLSEVRSDYPDARHHCWAYLIGDPSCAINAGMGDDGEPSGTAGKPILNVLNHKGVGDVMIIVVRYFGGIKLGAGGLTRAYGQAAQAVMAVLPLEQQIEMVAFQLVCDFALEQKIRHWVNILKGDILRVHYAQQVELEVSIPQQVQLAFIRKLQAVSCVFKLL